jgi:hypothetical protein
MKPFSFIKSSGGVWAPSSASVPLLAWYRPDLGLTQSGGLVTAWNDQSGAGDANRNQAAAGALRPGFTASDAAYGNKPTLTFSGSQSMACAGAFSVAIATPISVVVVGHTGASSAWLACRTPQYNAFGSYPNTASLILETSGTNAISTVTNTAAPGVRMFTDDGANWKMYDKNLTTPVGTAATPHWESNTFLDVGTAPGFASPCVGSIAEIIVFGGLLSGTDVANLRTYLNTTRAYGLAVT